MKNPTTYPTIDLSGQAPTVDLAGAAQLMKVHAKTVLELIASGELPAGRIGRGYVLMTRDVLALVERRIVEQTMARRGLTTGAGSAASRAGLRSA